MKLDTLAASIFPLSTCSGDVGDVVFMPNFVPSNTKLASASNSVVVAPTVTNSLTVALFNADIAPPPLLAASQTAFDPSHFRNCPVDGESWPIFVT